MMKKQIYALTVYLMVMEEFADLDAIYEDALIHLVGVRGVEALKENKLLESLTDVSCIHYATNSKGAKNDILDITLSNHWLDGLYGIP